LALWGPKGQYLLAPNGSHRLVKADLASTSRGASGSLGAGSMPSAKRARIDPLVGPAVAVTVELVAQSEELRLKLIMRVLRDQDLAV
jgi:hypothetical protein